MENLGCKGTQAHADCNLRAWNGSGSCLRGGFALQEFMERTGLPMSAISKGLDQAQAKGLISRDLGRVVPTERGFDFLSDLQEMFL